MSKKSKRENILYIILDIFPNATVMACFVRHISFIFLILLFCNSVEFSYGRDSVFFSKVTPGEPVNKQKQELSAFLSELSMEEEEQQQPSFFRNIGDGHGLHAHRNPTTIFPTMQDVGKDVTINHLNVKPVNNADDSLTNALEAYERGIKYAKILKKRMKDEGLKVAGNNGSGDEYAKKSLDAYEEGEKYAEFLENEMKKKTKSKYRSWASYEDGMAIDDLNKWFENRRPNKGSLDEGDLS